MFGGINNNIYLCGVIITQDKKYGRENVSI